MLELLLKKKQTKSDDMSLKKYDKILMKISFSSKMTRLQRKMTKSKKRIAKKNQLTR